MGWGLLRGAGMLPSAVSLSARAGTSWHGLHCSAPPALACTVPASQALWLCGWMRGSVGVLLLLLLAPPPTLRAPYQGLVVEPDSVVARLRDKRDPLRGNYCPAGATKPMTVCE
jgi:hypothetical protein